MRDERYRWGYKSESRAGMCHKWGQRRVTNGFRDEAQIGSRDVSQMGMSTTDTSLARVVLAAVHASKRAEA